MNRRISIFIAAYAVWILLAGFEAAELVLGAAVAVILSVLLASKLDFALSGKSASGLALFLLLYIPRFLIELVKANLDVARRVLSPSLPIRPGFVKVPTEIESEYGKLILANSITLTPGTLSMDMDDDSIYIHWIDVKGETASERQSQVSGAFEKLLRRIFK